MPVLYALDGPAMEPILPAKADAELIESLKMQMLSYYLVARHLYTTDAYRIPPERLSIKPK